MCWGLKIIKSVLYSFVLVFFLSGCETNVSQQTTVHKQIDQPNLGKIKPEHSSQKAIENNLWHYIANRSKLKPRNQRDIFWHIDWFKKNPDYLTRVTKRAKPYLYLITKEVEQAGLPIEVALLPIVESAYYPFSYSAGTASGLWQFIPSTGRLYGLKEDWWYDDRRDVMKSTRSAIKYLKNLSKLFNGDYLLAVAAYNSGPGRVQKAIKKNKKRGKKADFWNLDLPTETKGYVPRLLAVSELIKNPKKYGQTLTPVDNKPVLGKVVLDSQYDLALISDWTGLDLEQIYTLNPGLKRWATPNIDNHVLLLPVEKISLFNQQLKDYPKDMRIEWIRHKIQPGESLSLLAKKFNTTLNQIKDINQLKSNTIRAGDYLIVPVSQVDQTRYTLSEDQREKRRMEAKKPGEKLVHKVTKGESLWSIARIYQVTIRQIIKWNHLSNDTPLQVGKRLVIWQSKKSRPENLSSVVNTGIDINRKVHYRVKRGDNLSTIAKKFDVRVDDIVKDNHLDISKALQIGQKLTIFVNVVNSKMK